MPYDGRPEVFREEDDFAVFKYELQTAAACCVVAQDITLDSNSAKSPKGVLTWAREQLGATGVVAVSKCVSLPSCSQQFMAFESTNGKSTTYIIAFRADGELYQETAATSKATPAEMDNGNEFQVHKALWRRAAAMPLHSLPPHWKIGLHERRDRLILTGYSVGGAVAALATMRLLRTEGSSFKDQIRCYTFGAPLHGDKNYANCINYSYASHFYHAMIAGDPIPGILTLVSKVAKNIKPDLCVKVVSTICTVAGIAASVGLLAAGVPAGGVTSAVAHASSAAIDELWSNIRRLIKVEGKYREQSAPRLPEYKFGGTLLRMDADIRESVTITFGTRPGCDEFLDRVFCVRDDETSAPIVRNQGSLRIQRFLEIIQRVNRKDRSGLNSASTSASTSADLSQLRASTSNSHVAEPIGCFSFFPSPRAAEESWLLQPQFRDPGNEPISVCLDQNKRNINIVVHGENIVLGYHVLYFMGGEEKLRVPCVEYCVPGFMDTNDPQQSKLSSTRLPLRFTANIENTNNLDLKKPSGEFRVDLAFGSSKPIKSSEITIRIFDPLKEIQVAERFASAPPQELVNILITSGKATAQAKCCAAFNAIQKSLSEDVDAIVKELSTTVPEEFALLDKLLAFVDASQLGDAMQDLPEPMQEALKTDMVLEPKEGYLLPLFSADNPNSADWTFSKCFELTAWPMFTKETTLRDKLTARQLGKDLDEALVGPTKVLNAFLDWKLEARAYAKAYSYKKMKWWRREVRGAESAVTLSAYAFGSVPLVSAPLWILANYIEDPYIKFLTKFVGGAIGAPTALLGGGFVLSAYFLSHIALTPVRMLRSQPGIIDDLKRKFMSSKDQMDDWDTKLQAASILFELNSPPPHIACQMEYDLKKLTTGSSRRGRGCFGSKHDKLPFENSRYDLRPALQLANYGLAGATMHDIRRYLTELSVAVGLIGTSQAGKSCFAQQAFLRTEEEILYGPDLENRTRVMRRWTVPFEANREFTLIDFPGCTDEAEPDMYIRGLSLASVLVVIMSMKEFISTQTVALIQEVCKARRKDPNVSALFCFTHADTSYQEHRNAARRLGPPTAHERFTTSITKYKNELRSMLIKKGSLGSELDDICSDIHACNFADVEEFTVTQLADLEAADVKNIAWVKNWCLKKLSKIK